MNKFEWGIRPSYYGTLAAAAQSIVRLMQNPCDAAIQLTVIPFGRWDKVEIQRKENLGWCVHYTDNNSFIHYLVES